MPVDEEATGPVINSSRSRQRDYGGILMIIVAAMPTPHSSTSRRHFASFITLLFRPEESTARAVCPYS